MRGNTNERKKTVFLSHSSKDKFFVRKLAERLIDNGIKVWIDEAEINIGDSLTEKIGTAIKDTDFVCAVLSHNSINSNWVQKELQVALNREFSERKVIVLPVLLEAVEMPPFLADKLRADFSTAEKYEENFPRLLKAFGVELPKGKETENHRKSGRIKNLRIDDEKYFNSVTNLHNLLFEAINKSNQITKSNYNQIILLAKGDLFKELVVFADITEKNTYKYRFVGAGGIISDAFRMERTFNIPDVRKHKNYIDAITGTVSELSMPIYMNRKIVGIFNSESKLVNYYTDAMVSELSSLLAEFSIYLDKLGYSPKEYYTVIPYVSVDI